MGHDNQTVEIQGTRVPRLGFGTWELTGSDAVEGVRDALEIGYRHIDTARAYDNEAEVGRGIGDSGVAREEIFLTTKVPPDDAEPDAVKAAAEGSLAALGTDHVDLLLLHWPNPDVPLQRTLAAMAELREDGRARQIGVSNFPADLLREALELAPVFCNQVEYHPFLRQGPVLEIAREHDVLVTAYSPLARGRIPRDETFTRLGERHGKSAGQVALRWLLDQQYVAAIPKASSRERRAENLDVFDFELSAEETREIDALDKSDRVIDPAWAPDWDT